MAKRKESSVPDELLDVLLTATCPTRALMGIATLCCLPVAYADGGISAAGGIGLVLFFINLAAIGIGIGVAWWLARRYQHRWLWFVSIPVAVLASILIMAVLFD